MVIAHPEVWSAEVGRLLAGLGLPLIECHQLHEAVDIWYERSVALLIVAAREPQFLVKACRSVRGLRELPLLAIVGDEDEVVDVLEAGADDCVSALVPPEVVLARARALLRRVIQQGGAGRLILVRDLCIDLGRCEVSMQGQRVNLTPAEFRLLACLAERAGRVVDSQILVKAMHGYDADDRDAQSIVKTHIANLRRKLEAHQPEQPYIVCLRGFGYMLERRAAPRPGDSQPDDTGEPDRGRTCDCLRHLNPS